MRLIDADAIPYCEYDLDNHFWFRAVEDDVIANMPTIDAVPAVHGRWFPVPSSDMVTGKAYECSECKKMRFGSFRPNYCPNCGAKMDGEA